jgi:hypothetical protein
MLFAGEELREIVARTQKRIEFRNEHGRLDHRSKRVAAESPATLLTAKAKVNRFRLSGIEHGYVQAGQDELQRLNRALEQLIERERQFQKTAVAAVATPGDRND